MKSRIGFVSNSSSSSFLVISNQPLTKENLLEDFQIPPTSPLHSWADGIASFITKSSKPYTLEEIREDYEQDSEIPEHIQQALRDKKVLSTFRAHNDSNDSIEMALYWMGLNYQSESLTIRRWY